MSSFSIVNSFGNIFTEFFERDSISVETSNSMNYLQKLLFIKSIFKLIINIFKLIHCKLSSTLKIIKTEIGSFSLLSKWISLILIYKFTILVVKAFKNSSKDTFVGLASLTSERTLKTISYF